MLGFGTGHSFFGSWRNLIFILLSVSIKFMQDASGFDALILEIPKLNLSIVEMGK